MDFAAIADAGLAGVMIVMLWFQSKKDQMFNDTIADHNRILEEHFKEDKADRKDETEAKINLTIALKEMAKSVAKCQTKETDKN